MVRAKVQEMRKEGLLHAFDPPDSEEKLVYNDSGDSRRQEKDSGYPNLLWEDSDRAVKESVLSTSEVAMKQERDPPIMEKLSTIQNHYRNNLLMC